MLMRNSFLISMALFVANAAWAYSFPEFEEPTLNTARALNNRDQVAGASGPFIAPDQPLRATLWSKGALRDLGDFGWSPDAGLAINDRGQVAGHMSVPTGFRSRVAFIGAARPDPAAGPGGGAA